MKPDSVFLKLWKGWSYFQIVFLLTGQVSCSETDDSEIKEVSEATTVASQSENNHADLNFAGETLSCEVLANDDPVARAQTELIIMREAKLNAGCQIQGQRLCFAFDLIEFGVTASKDLQNFEENLDMQSHSVEQALGELMGAGPLENHEITFTMQGHDLVELLPNHFPVESQQAVEKLQSLLTGLCENILQSHL